mmetsp:Transcript_11006/g.12581  ORF Transcript_11006/g.12581 Transcript_11006/m.12581 type:complete len:174 (+) Transcript_11006:122-643(+)
MATLPKNSGKESKKIIIGADYCKSRSWSEGGVGGMKYDENTDITLDSNGTFTYKHTKTSIDTYDYDRSVTTVKARGKWVFDEGDDDENDDGSDDGEGKEKEAIEKGEKSIPSLTDGAFVKLSGTSSEKDEWDSYNDFCNGEAFYRDNGSVESDNFTFSFRTSDWTRSCLKYKE